LGRNLPGRAWSSRAIRVWAKLDGDVDRQPTMKEFRRIPIGAGQAS
jgi:hypothetical protein